MTLPLSPLIHTSDVLSRSHRGLPSRLQPRAATTPASCENSTDPGRCDDPHADGTPIPASAAIPIRSATATPPPRTTNATTDRGCTYESVPDASDGNSSRWRTGSDTFPSPRCTTTDATAHQRHTPT